jgi:2-polyprenyl-6-hydroxyphenyl methylase / 3-demethylubiquinone-9 3-methyltransferase
MSTSSAQLQLTPEVQKFDALAHEFWDSRGAFQPLHVLNPVRLEYITQRTAVAQRRVLDVGCGGGLLTESLARAGARARGIDLSPSMIEVARLHAHESQLQIDYEVDSAEHYAQRAPASCEVITCMELIEHVPSPAALLGALATLLRPGGSLFISTLNRNLRAFVLAIVGAEYLLRLIPRGTHAYAQLLRPAELARLARAHGLELRDIRGIAFNPFTRSARLISDPSVNYLAHFELAS